MKRIIAFLYNIDRAVASLCGAPPQETISSEVGRVATGQEHTSFILTKISDALAWCLNKVQPGHTAKAIVHADALDKADNGDEK